MPTASHRDAGTSESETLPATRFAQKASTDAAPGKWHAMPITPTPLVRLGVDNTDAVIDYEWRVRARVCVCVCVCVCVFAGV